MNLQGRPITDVLRDLDNGDVVNEATQKLYELVAAVMDTRRPGILKLTLGIAPTGKGSVEVLAKVELKEPKHDSASTTFFVAKDGALVRNDPNQPRLPLREIMDSDTGEIRRVAD